MVIEGGAFNLKATKRHILGALRLRSLGRCWLRDFGLLLVTSVYLVRGMQQVCSGAVPCGFIQVDYKGDLD